MKQALNIRGMYMAFPGDAETLSGHTLENQTASDLGYTACTQLVNNLGITKETVSAVIYVGTSPDYRSPATACVLHGRLNLNKDCAAFDINISSTGFSHAMNLGMSLISEKKDDNVLLIIGDTPSKWLDPDGSEFNASVDCATAICLGSKRAINSEIEIQNYTFSSGSDIDGIKNGGFRYEGTQMTVDFLHHSASSYGFLTTSESFISEKNRNTIGAIEDYWKEKGKSDDVDFWLLDYQLKEVSDWLISQGVDASTIYLSNQNYYGSMAPEFLIKLLDKNGQKALNIIAVEVAVGMSVGITELYLTSGHQIESGFSATNEIFTNGFVDHQM